MQMQELFQQLLRIKSLSKEEEELARFIIEYAKKHGLSAERQDANVVIKFEVGSSKCLIFNAHMDTVAEGQVSHWRHPPYGPGAGEIEGERIFGLGASDMKATITSYLELAKEFAVSKPPIDVFFVFVVQEELDGYGSKIFVEDFLHNDRERYSEVAAILGEPTDLQYIEKGHRGSAFVRITTQGDSGHGSRPDQIKKHAVYEMLMLIEELNERIEELSNSFRCDVLGRPTFTLTGLGCSESSPNKIPAQCHSVWDIRTTEALHAKLSSVLAGIIADRAEIEFIGEPCPCAVVDENERIVSVLKEVVPNVELRLSPGANDSCMFIDANIPAVAFGPGSKSLIHRENEYALLPNVLKAKEIYRSVVRAF